MRPRAMSATVGLSVLAVALIFPVAGVASPIGRPGQGRCPGGGWAWPTGWSGSCGAAGSGGVSAAASCSAIQLDNPAAWQGHHLGPARSPRAREGPPAPSTSGYAPIELQQASGLTTAHAADGTGETVGGWTPMTTLMRLSNLWTSRGEWGPRTRLWRIGGHRVRHLHQGQPERGEQRPLPVGQGTSWSEEISLSLDMVSAICPRVQYLAG